MSSSQGNPGDESDKERHLSLAAVVKGVHSELRRKYKESGDCEEIWQEHCQNKTLLAQYADAMHNLATTIWTKNPETRIHWCHKICREYFIEGGLKKVLNKELRRMMYNKNDPDESSVTKSESNIQCEVKSDILDCSERDMDMITFQDGSRIRLLDVGSCYNAFKEFKEFHTVGIDLSPAVQDVKQCDFLCLDIVEELTEDVDAFLDGLPNPLAALPAGIFHVVVFSLLLEYFPSSHQRWICCQKAHDLLALNGILIIITPDSHHQQRNAVMIKSWRFAIESLGFRRWKYVKQEHLHCMVFRKVTDQIPTVSAVDHTSMYIPQDLRDGDSHEDQISSEFSSHDVYDTTALKDNFDELPGFVGDID